MKPSETMLEVAKLSAGYGRVQVIRDAALTVRAGEVVGLVGRNGAGKTTFISAVAGLLDKASGVVRLGDRDISALQASERVKAGIALVARHTSGAEALTCFTTNVLRNGQDGILRSNPCV